MVDVNRTRRPDKPFTIRTHLREREGPPQRVGGTFDRQEPQEEQGGTIANTLFFQTVACGLVLFLCLTVFSGSSALALQVRAWYAEVAGQPAISLEPQDLQVLGRLLDSSIATMAAVGEGTQPQPAYTGQGGWWPVAGAQDLPQAAPTGASLGEAVLSATGRYPAYGQVTCGYGWRVHPITGEDDFHSGVDIGAPEGASIYTAYPGVVTKRGTSSIYGNYIEVTHSDSVKTVYCHCSQLLAPEGAKLRAGERVALVGSTGISTGPHLHYEVLVNNVTFSPLPQLGLG